MPPVRLVIGKDGNPDQCGDRLVASPGRQHGLDIEKKGEGCRCQAEAGGIQGQRFQGAVLPVQQDDHEQKRRKEDEALLARGCKQSRYKRQIGAAMTEQKGGSHKEKEAIHRMPWHRRQVMDQEYEGDAANENRCLPFNPVSEAYGASQQSGQSLFQRHQ